MPEETQSDQPEAKSNLNPLFKGSDPDDKDEVVVNSLTGKPWHEDSGSTAEMRFAVRHGFAHPVTKRDYDKKGEVKVEDVEAFKQLVKDSFDEVRAEAFLKNFSEVLKSR